MTVPLDAAIKRYLEHLRVERRYAVGTITNYARELNYLLQFVEPLNLRHWRELRSESLRQLVAREHRRGRESGSLHHLLSACRASCRAADRAHGRRRHSRSGNPGVVLFQRLAQRRVGRIALARRGYRRGIGARHR
jgi:hypothetical protein